MTISQCPWISRICHAWVSRCSFGVNIAAIVEATDWVIHLTPIGVIFSNLPLSCSKGRHTQNRNSACSRSLSPFYYYYFFYGYCSGVAPPSCLWSVSCVIIISDLLVFSEWDIYEPIESAMSRPKPKRIQSVREEPLSARM